VIVWRGVWRSEGEMKGNGGIEDEDEESFGLGYWLLELGCHGCASIYHGGSQAVFGVRFGYLFSLFK